ncbi:unnamed protein product [Amoebophrya sp. A120]|nr:unnamed protein product [Amoebophrya sp. A120]|eukprot:GSA120T00024164001.1
MQQVEEKLLKARKDLARVGEQPASVDAVVREAQKVLAGAQCDVEERITEELERFVQGITETEENITKQWTDSKYKKNAFHPPQFQGEEAVKKCMREIVDIWWAPLLGKFRGTLEKYCVKSALNLDKCLATSEI